MSVADPLRPSQDILRHRAGLLIRHQSHVREHCFHIADVLFERGEFALAAELYARGQAHDHSKWLSPEWEWLHPDVREVAPHLFQRAYEHHVLANDHHVECWGDIRRMTRAALLELTADIVSRGGEFGTSTEEYLVERFMPKYGLQQSSPEYEVIRDGLDILFEGRF